MRLDPVTRNELLEELLAATGVKKADLPEYDLSTALRRICSAVGVSLSELSQKAGGGRQELEWINKGDYREPCSGSDGEWGTCPHRMVDGAALKRCFLVLGQIAQTAGVTLNAEALADKPEASPAPQASEEPPYNNSERQEIYRQLLEGYNSTRPEKAPNPLEEGASNVAMNALSTWCSGKMEEETIDISHKELKIFVDHRLGRHIPPINEVFRGFRNMPEGRAISPNAAYIIGELIGDLERQQSPYTTNGAAILAEKLGTDAGQKWQAQVVHYMRQHEITADELAARVADHPDASIMERDIGFMKKRIKAWEEPSHDSNGLGVLKPRGKFLTAISGALLDLAQQKEQAKLAPPPPPPAPVIEETPVPVPPPVRQMQVREPDVAAPPPAPLPEIAAGIIAGQGVTPPPPVEVPPAILPVTVPASTVEKPPAPVQPRPEERKVVAPPPAPSEPEVSVKPSSVSTGGKDRKAVIREEGSFGETLREIRDERLQRTQKWLAEKMTEVGSRPIEVSQVKAWEQNKNLNQLDEATLRSMSKALYQGLQEKGKLPLQMDEGEDIATEEQLHAFLASALRETIENKRELDETFGVAILSLRKKAGFRTTEELTEKLGSRPGKEYSGKDIARVEAGAQPDDEFMEAMLASEFGRRYGKTLREAHERQKLAGWVVGHKFRASELSSEPVPLPDDISRLVDEVNAQKRRAAACFIPSMKNLDHAIGRGECEPLTKLVKSKKLVQTGEGMEPEEIYLHYDMVHSALWEIDKKVLERISFDTALTNQADEARHHICRSRPMKEHHINRILLEAPEGEAREAARQEWTALARKSQQLYDALGSWQRRVRLERREHRDAAVSLG